ncbi:hypothetical protein K474DRAFT_1670875 [Panus rudis PR-1116 ss-1]|nr:hypothetical protein K474DRAFT_1670875 [Panus rudis PR-1116 ss-1]
MKSSFLLIVALSTLAQSCAAQTLVNGQVFTKGLAIVDSPAPNSQLHAGSNIAIAIDVSGNGQLKNWQTASVPGSNEATRFDSLEIYLSSYPNSLNLTVSQGPGLLANESGSTVKHLNYPVSTCVPSGQYNLSFYEVSHINNEEFFSITNLPVEIQNTQVSGGCDQTNGLASFPEPDNAPQQNPFLASNSGGSQVPPASPALRVLPYGVWSGFAAGMSFAFAFLAVL